MYTQHYGLSQDPFSIAPDPRYLFMSERHREALAHLLFGVAGSDPASSPHMGHTAGTGGGFVLLTGDIGTGKTTICRCFLEQIPANCHVAYIFNPKLNVLELLQSICDEFHIPVAQPGSQPVTVKTYIDSLNVFLLQAHASGQSCVLIIDEAQNLSPDVLEQLRLLTNLETSTRKLLQIVLIGQPELRTMLAAPELEQLAQRVIARFHLDALSPTETTHYISHRLAIAGHTGELPFDAKALSRIHQLSRGVPRRINLLCARALLGAWATGGHQVTRVVADKAAAEVFGTDNSYASKWPIAKTWQALAALISIAFIGGLAVWFWPKPLPETTQKIAAAASQPAMPVSASGTRPAAAVSAQTTASAPAPAILLTPLESLLPQLHTNISTAWRELAPAWKLPAAAPDPCVSASVQLIQCYRTTGLSVPQLRQLARPGILTLQTEAKTSAFAVLTALNDQTATLQVAGKAHQVRLMALAKYWRGDFATYWQAPPAYQADLRDDSVGPPVDWLADKLAQLDGTRQTSGPARLDGALRERVRAFQAARGITADGQPGPMTFMQIESALGLQQPKLLQTPVTAP